MKLKITLNIHFIDPNWQAHETTL